MAKYKNMGRVMAFDLGEYGYKGYQVYCTYYFDNTVDKYSLTMYLKRTDIDDLYWIDTQHISGDIDVIRNNIIRIVQYAATHKFYEKYIDQFEFTQKCCSKGYELFEEQEDVAS